jgi:hypothetical protein
MMQELPILWHMMQRKNTSGEKASEQHSSLLEEAALTLAQET